MKYIQIAITFTVLCTYAVAEIEEHHAHKGTTKLKLSHENLDFTNSLKKENGRRYGLELDYHSNIHHFQFYTDHTNTQTIPKILKNLLVNKYSFKYQYQVNKDIFSLSYMTINDNLMKEVDGGNIYGLGYKYKSFNITQYISDYKHFNVYQSDIKWNFKKEIDDVMLMGTIVGKYMHLQDRKSNTFTNKVKEDYFTLGVKAHVHYDGWHLGAGIYVGERIFAVMNEGLKVQHHAMEFKKSVMLSVGKELGENIVVHMRYTKHYATEVPIEHSGVEVDALSLELSYTF